MQAATRCAPQRLRPPLITPQSAFCVRFPQLVSLGVELVRPRGKQQEPRSIAWAFFVSTPVLYRVGSSVSLGLYLHRRAWLSLLGQFCPKTASDLQSLEGLLLSPAVGLTGCPVRQGVSECRITDANGRNFLSRPHRIVRCTDNHNNIRLCQRGC